MDHLADALGVNPMRIDSIRRDPGWHDLLALLELVWLIRRKRPHIVHTHAAKAGTLGRIATLLAARGRGTRPVLVHTFHGHSLTGYFSPRTAGFYRGVERRLARRTDRLIAVSEQIRNDLVGLGVAPATRFTVLPLGFEFAPFQLNAAERAQARARVREELSIAKDATVVTLVARLVPIKRVDRFLAAARTLTDLSSAHFLIVGDGELRDVLHRSADAKALTGRLTWAGFRNDIPEIYYASDIAALCSDNEGTPVSLIEASAADLPTVSTRVGGAAGVVLDGVTGVLTERDDAHALASAIRRLAVDEALRARMGRAGREHALSSFSLDRLIADMDQLYRELLSRPAA
jgi:glycosyltransferase involved in cell wall biosynthesis